VDLFDLIVGFFAGVGLLALVALAIAGISEWREGRGDTDWMPDFDLDDDGDAVALAQAHAEALDEEGEWFMMTPEVLEQEPLFESGVDALSDEGTPVSAVIDLARHPDGWAASMALVALERREDVPDEWVDAAIRALPRPSNCEDAFQLRAIARHAGGRAIGRILGRTEGIYPGYVVDFVTARSRQASTSTWTPSAAM